MEELVVLPGGDAWRVGDTTFTRSFKPTSSSPESFCIRKPQSLINLYRDLASGLLDATIVELGIAAGGSTALLSLLGRPRRLVALELSPDPIAALSTFIAQHGLESVVTPFYGVDQGDRAAVAELIDQALLGSAIDLVIDDASHLYDETLASFEVLYPRVQPGGRFIIEDWAADYAYARQMVATLSRPSGDKKAELEQLIGTAMAQGADRRRPLPRLGVELLHLAGSSPDIVSRLEINRHWICVTRGPAELDPRTFCLADHYTDHWHWLTSSARVTRPLA